jgi:hypothetical protein
MSRVGMVGLEVQTGFLAQNKDPLLLLIGTMPFQVILTPDQNQCQHVQVPSRPQLTQGHRYVSIKNTY